MKRVLLFVAAICMVVACSKSDQLFEDELLTDTLKKGAAITKTVAVPLKADFTVWLKSYVPGECGDYTIQLTMEGEGNISHLGIITTEMVFCADAGLVGPYGDGTGKFVAADGDELYFDFDYGLIVWNEGDDAAFYPTRFNDKVLFTGGTGRFEEASGYFWTKAFVHYPDPEDTEDIWHTDFFSTGILVLVKGKR